MIKLYGRARLIEDFPVANGDGTVTVLPAGLVGGVTDIYTDPPGYEMDFDYGEEGVQIGVPPEYLEEA